MRLMVVAAPEEIIESYYTLAERLEMKLECIDYAGNSTLQIIKQQVLDKIILIEPLLICYQKILDLETGNFTHHIDIITVAIGKQDIF